MLVYAGGFLTEKRIVAWFYDFYFFTGEDKTYISRALIHFLFYLFINWLHDIDVLSLSHLLFTYEKCHLSLLSANEYFFIVLKTIYDFQDWLFLHFISTMEESENFLQPSNNMLFLSGIAYLLPNACLFCLCSFLCILNWRDC